MRLVLEFTSSLGWSKVLRVKPLLSRMSLAGHQVGMDVVAKVISFALECLPPGYDLISAIDQISGVAGDFR